MAGKEIVQGTINLGKGAKKVYNVVSSLFRNGEEVAQETRKLIPRKAANQKINNMLSEASKISDEQIAAQQHASRVTARIRKNSGGNKGLENNLKLRQKYAEQKYGKDFENKLINELDFSVNGARKYANEEKLRYINKYLTDKGITPKNLTHAEANSINKAVENSFKVQQQKKIQDIEKLAERYNKIYPTFSPKGAAYIVGGIGGAGLLGGTVYNALTSGISEESEQPQSKYRYTSGNGWEKNENGKWIPQQREFGVDKNGNVNYYDGQNWVSDYIQDSDGTIHNSQGQVIGSAVDPIAMHSSGYDNIFDYNAAQAGISPDQVAAVQQALGVTPDGKWGARTQAAYEQAMNNIYSYYDPNSLFSIYQRKMQFGY